MHISRRKKVTKPKLLSVFQHFQHVTQTIWWKQGGFVCQDDCCDKGNLAEGFPLSDCVCVVVHVNVSHLQKALVSYTIHSFHHTSPSISASAVYVEVGFFCMKFATRNRTYVTPWHMSNSPICICLIQESEHAYRDDTSFLYYLVFINIYT